MPVLYAALLKWIFLCLLRRANELRVCLRQMRLKHKQLKIRLPLILLFEIKDAFHRFIGELAFCICSIK